MEKFINPIFFPIYELCIDTSNVETLWTKHKIMTPAMFLTNNRHEQSTQNENATDCEHEISTDPLIFDTTYFTNLKTEYSNQKVILYIKSFILKQNLKWYSTRLIADYEKGAQSMQLTSVKF